MGRGSHCYLLLESCYCVEIRFWGLVSPLQRKRGVLGKIFMDRNCEFIFIFMETSLTLTLFLQHPYFLS